MTIRPTTTAHHDRRTRRPVRVGLAVVLTAVVTAGCAATDDESEDADAPATGAVTTADDSADTVTPGGEPSTPAAPPTVDPDDPLVLAADPDTSIVLEEHAVLIEVFPDEVETITDPSVRLRWAFTITDLSGADAETVRCSHVVAQRLVGVRNPDGSEPFEPDASWEPGCTSAYPALYRTPQQYRPWIDDAVDGSTLTFEVGRAGSDVPPTRYAYTVGAGEPPTRVDG